MIRHRLVAAALRWWLERVTRFPVVTLLTMVLLAVLSLQFAAQHLRIDTDTANLLDPDVGFRQAFARYTERFPQYDDTLVAVIEAPAPELAAATADRLVRVLRREQDIFPLVYQPRANVFLERRALLYLDSERLAVLGDRLARAQPLLARLVRDPSIGGYFDILTEVVERSDDQEAFRPLLERTAGALAPGGGTISWQGLMQGEQDRVPDAGGRALVVAAPRLQFDRIMAGRVPMERLDRVIDDLAASHPHSRIRVTGKVALQHEELLSALGGARQAGLAALVLVALVLYAALRSWSLLAVALTTLVIGMALSAGAATVTVGHLNLISIAFAVLYVGLGINYAVHYLVRYLESLAAGRARRDAIMDAGERLGGALALCTVTTAIGFFAFVPTAFAGVAELGIIAGVSMFITLAVTYTLLPALLGLLPAPDATHFRAGLPLPEHWLSWPAGHPAKIRITALALAVAGVLLALQVRFDADPLNLRDPASESVATAMDLLADGDAGRRHLVMLADSRERLRELVPRLESLDTVRNTVDLFDLVPANQSDKLRQIRDLEFVLGPTVTRGKVELRDDPERSTALESARRLRDALQTREPGGGSDRLAQALDDWVRRVRSAPAGSSIVRDSQDRLLATLPLALSRLQTALRGAEAFGVDDLPRSLRERYLSPDGHYLLQVFSDQDLRDPEAQRRFVDSVREVAPNATGIPVLQVESGRAVVSAFRTALGGAVAGIAVVLLLLLRSAGLAIRVLIPLLLGGVLTVAAMVLLGLPFNFANVIALPLLFGVGVDNGIHMVSRQRELHAGSGGALRTSTARAILFGSLATIVSFGNLASSPHLGTASMGLVLAVGMILILATPFLVLPALFRRAGHRHDGPADP